MNRYADSDPIDVASPRLNRRQLVTQLAAAGFAAPVIASILASETAAQDATPGAAPQESIVDPSITGKSEQLIAYNSLNLGTPLELIDGLIVPNDLFFVRSHAPTPSIAAEDWRLTVNGLVDSELELSLADLQGMSPRTITAFLECSGDSRSRFEPPAEGTQWGNTAVGNAEWTGVSLIDVLKQAGINEDAAEVVSQGGDYEEMRRGLPLTKAHDPDTMIVWQMNGEPLPSANGGPVRLFVPGWGGIASTKWLTGLELIDHPFQGRYNLESYIIITPFERVVRLVQEMPVKSAIASPTPYATLSPGEHTITGFAWSGYAGIQSVEVSTNGGRSWEPAEITEEAGPISWVRFEYVWDAVAGEAPQKLASRATDRRALQQPVHIDWNAKGYQMNEIYEVPVLVG